MQQCISKIIPHLSTYPNMGIMDTNHKFSMQRINNENYAKFIHS
jgi:hypothetical protein